MVFEKIVKKVIIFSINIVVKIHGFIFSFMSNLFYRGTRQ